MKNVILSTVGLVAMSLAACTMEGATAEGDVVGGESSLDLQGPPAAPSGGGGDDGSGSGSSSGGTTGDSKGGDGSFLGKFCLRPRLGPVVTSKARAGLAAKDARALATTAGTGVAAIDSAYSNFRNALAAAETLDVTIIHRPQNANKICAAYGNPYPYEQFELHGTQYGALSSAIMQLGSVVSDFTAPESSQVIGEGGASSEVFYIDPVQFRKYGSTTGTGASMTLPSALDTSTNTVWWSVNANVGLLEGSSYRSSTAPVGSWCVASSKWGTGSLTYGFGVVASHPNSPSYKVCVGSTIINP